MENRIRIVPPLVGRGPSPDRKAWRSLRTLVLPEHCYFITTNTFGRQLTFGETPLAEIVVSNLRFYRDRGDFLLHAFVVMPDHLHLATTPLKGSISDVMRNVKSYVAKEVREITRRPGPVWQDGFYDRMIRTERHFHRVADYIHENPVAANLCDVATEWRFSSARWYAGLESEMCMDRLWGNSEAP